jgi:hypothetical protein
MREDFKVYILVNTLYTYVHMTWGYALPDDNGHVCFVLYSTWCQCTSLIHNLMMLLFQSEHCDFKNVQCLAKFKTLQIDSKF